MKLDFIIAFSNNKNFDSNNCIKRLSIKDHIIILGLQDPDKNSEVVYNLGLISAVMRT